MMYLPRQVSKAKKKQIKQKNKKNTSMEANRKSFVTVMKPSEDLFVKVIINKYFIDLLKQMEVHTKLLPNDKDFWVTTRLKDVDFEVSDINNNYVEEFATLFDQEDYVNAMDNTIITFFEDNKINFPIGLNKDNGNLTITFYVEKNNGEVYVFFEYSDYKTGETLSSSDFVLNDFIKAIEHETKGFLID